MNKNILFAGALLMYTAALWFEHESAVSGAMVLMWMGLATD